MKMKYKFGRLYDFCTPDDLETTSRNIIRRKDRIPLGVFSYTLILTYTLLKILGVYNNITILVIILISTFGFIYMTRMGPISFFNIFMINNTRKNINQSILDKFYIYHNRDGNYIKIQEKEMFKIKYDIFNWSKVRIYFRDKQKNKYLFRVNLKEVYIKISFSKSSKKIFTEKTYKTTTKYRYKLSDLSSIRDAQEFMIFLRDNYREIREKIISQ